jgi:hypothetical protein
VAKEGIQTQVGVQLGYAFVQDAEGGEPDGPGVRLQLLARFNDYFAIGPEAAYYHGAGSGTRVTQNPEGGETTDDANNGALLVLSGALRLGPDTGFLRPCFLLGPALAATESDGVLGGFVGMEVGIAPWRLPVVLDARYYLPLTGSESGYPRHLSVGLGTRF